MAQHPCSHFLPAALTSSHAHSPSYHAFISSSNASTTSVASTSASSNSKKTSKAPPTPLPPPLKNAIPAVKLHGQLLKWYDSVKDDRGMPWRKEQHNFSSLTKEERSQRGYEVWVSEIMLQQTQVATVKAYYTRWMAAFPTLASLASADIERVNELWKGLGYYSRAARLLAGAKRVVSEFGGLMPEDSKDLEKVDGIGPYSAGAISSIAFHRRAAMVDGNVTRVLSRLVALHAPATAKATTTFVWALADSLVPPPEPSKGEVQLDVGGPNKPGSWNQALMELGATVCTPKNPNCGQCPLKEDCLAYAEVRQLKSLKNPFSSAKSSASVSTPTVDIEDLCTLCTPFNTSGMAVTQYPQAKERKKSREEETSVCVLEWEPLKKEGEKAKRKVLLVKRPDKGLLAGLFEFPAVDLPPATPSTAASRKKYLHSLLSTLLVDTLPALNTPSTSTSSKSLQILSVTDLSSITQVYSHQVREYHILRVVLTSSTLPELATAKSGGSSSKGALVQSVVGRAKWVEEDEVEGSNTGGAVGKVWEVRQGGKPKVVVKRKANGGGAAKKKGKKESSEEVETEEEEVEVVSEVEVEPVVISPRKKRRIIISESEDED